MNLEELLGTATNFLDQAAQVVNKGTSIFDSVLGKTPDVVTTVPVSSAPAPAATLTTAQFEGPLPPAGYWFEQNKVLILLAVAGLVIWKMR